MELLSPAGHWEAMAAAVHSGADAVYLGCGALNARRGAKNFTPEELPAQWGFCWSTDPSKALPFISLSTSPYNTGDCCTQVGHVWRSGMDGNVWAPGTTGAKWEDLGETPLSQADA